MITLNCKNIGQNNSVHFRMFRKNRDAIFCFCLEIRSRPCIFNHFKEVKLFTEQNFAIDILSCI